MEEKDPPASEPPSPAPNETQSESVSSTSSEPPKGEPPEIPKTPPNSFWRELVLAAVQHANRSIAIFLIAFIVGIGIFLFRKQLACWLANAQSVKVGTFEVRVQEAVRSKGLDTEFSKLANLDDQQLQLFLVLGKERRSKAAGEHSIAYSGEEITGPNLNKLKEIGLLATVTPTGPNTFTWTVTDTGTRLHHLLLEHVVSSIKDAAKAADCKCK